MNNFPTVNPTDFHMTNYPASIYSEIETFCNENEFTVDYFLQEFAQQGGFFMYIKRVNIGINSYACKVF